MSIFRWFRVVL